MKPPDAAVFLGAIFARLQCFVGNTTSFLSARGWASIERTVRVNFFFLFFRADVVCVQDVQEMSEYKAQFRVELRLQSESFEFDCVLVTWSVHRRLQVNNVLKSLLNAALQHFTDLQPVELRLVAGEKKTILKRFKQVCFYYLTVVDRASTYCG